MRSRNVHFHPSVLDLTCDQRVNNESQLLPDEYDFDLSSDKLLNDSDREHLMLRPPIIINPFADMHQGVKNGAYKWVINVTENYILKYTMPESDAW